jgi:hypothetical protein
MACPPWRSGPVQRFSNCCSPKPQLPSGFFLKKKPPCTTPVTARKLENRSEGQENSLAGGRNCNRPYGSRGAQEEMCDRSQCGESHAAALPELVALKMAVFRRNLTQMRRFGRQKSAFARLLRPATTVYLRAILLSKLFIMSSLQSAPRPGKVRKWAFFGWRGVRGAGCFGPFCSLVSMNYRAPAEANFMQNAVWGSGF